MLGINPLDTSNRTGAMVLGAVVAVLVALLLGGWWGWTRGSESARNELRSEYSANLVEAQREAAIKQQAAITFANALSVDLTNTKRTIEAQRVSLRGRIVYVTRETPADCSFAPAVVQLWNEAWTLPAAAVPQAAGAR